jgi:hypothetical protein
MVYFHTNNPYLGKFWSALERELLVHFRTIWNILQQFCVFYGHLVYSVVIWYIFPVLGIKNLASLHTSEVNSITII